ncbi:MAG: hypothetical protein MRY83_10505 [Flavobacteriales bacterium]|nr:hypothetical protein [Flavobacteriales bacterium]
MKNIKSIVFLKSLSTVEFKKLSAFFDSEFFSMYNSSRKLHSILVPFYPSFRKLPSKELIYKSLYPGDFNEKKWYLTVSRYYKSLEDFAAHTRLSNNALLKEQLTFEELIDRADENIISEKLKMLKKMCSKRTFPVSQRLYTEIQIEELCFDYYSKLQKSESMDNLQDLFENIDYHFLYLKLKYSCELLTRKNVFAQEFDFSSVDLLINYASGRIDEEKPVIYTYFRLLNLVRNGAEEDYIFLKDYIFNNVDNIELRDLRDMNVFMINFCIKMINTGRQNYLSELLDLYQRLLEFKIIIEGDFLNLFDFKNISTVAIRLKKYKWLESFTENYLPYIRNEYRIVAEAYNLSRIAFEKGDYKKVISHLRTLDYPDIYYELDCRILLIKVYYERDEFEFFEINSNSLKQLVERSKSISSYQKLTYRNFLRWSGRLMRLKERAQKMPKKWLQEYSETNELADRTWISEKMSRFD